MSNFTDVHKPWLNYRINALQIDSDLGTKNATFEAGGTVDVNGTIDFTGASVIGLPSTGGAASGIISITTTGAGAVTGLTFAPKLVYVIMFPEATATTNSIQSYGVLDSTLAVGNASTYNLATGNIYQSGVANSIFNVKDTTGATIVSANACVLTADGFSWNIVSCTGSHAYRWMAWG